MLTRLSILWKITIFAFGIVFVSLLVTGIIYVGNIFKIKEDEIRQRTMITARTIAQVPEVIYWANQSEGAKMINPIVERIRMINNVDYIVVLNMEKERLSHPIKERIGTRFTGGDEGPAFAEHIYSSKAKGELGLSIRSFVPIMNEDLNQVGVVVVGEIIPSYFDLLMASQPEITIMILLALLFGLWGYIDKNSE